MAFNINEMRGQMALGGARPTLFQVQISNPANGNGDIKVPFMVEAATLPPSTLGSIDIPYFGRKVKFAGDRTFPGWTVTVINDEDFLIRNAMEDWMQTMNSHLGNVRALSAATPFGYKSTGTITQFSKTGVPIRVYQFNGLFPTGLQEIEMNWGSNDQIERFDVSFQYDWWEISGGITGNAGGN